METDNGRDGKLPGQWKLCYTGHVNDTHTNITFISIQNSVLRQHSGQIQGTLYSI